MGEEDLGGIDFSGFDNLDITDLLNSGSNNIDFSQIPGDFGGNLSDELAAALSDSGNSSSLFSGDGGIDLSSLIGMDTGPEAFDISSFLGGDQDISRSLGSLASGNNSLYSLARLSDTDGLQATGRGQLSIVDRATGATGLTGEGFQSLKDLLGSGTAEEIARYSPETVNYSFRSGIDAKDGQGFTGDATRGMGLAQMGGAQGLSQYIPAQYSESLLRDLVKNNPGKFTEIEQYLDSQYDKAGLTPFRGSGGTLSETGFLAQSSKANPFGAKYAIGDPNSFINNPTITGQQAAVSPGRTIIDNKDGTYKVVTNTIDGTKTIVTDKAGVDKIIGGSKTDAGTNKGAGAGTSKTDNNMLLLLLALMAMMNKGGSSSGASTATIPELSASRSQLPYGKSSGSTARPGAGGVQYFTPTTYTPKAAGGGLMALAGGGMSDLGSYSDGGHLLRGPGDGVSDSIPATIADKQPARLATGEFVVPARIVSELGNGSTDAGAKRLYEMMDRVQKTRRKTKGVATDTKAHKYLPA